MLTAQSFSLDHQGNGLDRFIPFFRNPPGSNLWGGRRTLLGRDGENMISVSKTNVFQMYLMWQPSLPVLIPTSLS